MTAPTPPVALKACPHCNHGEIISSEENAALGLDGPACPKCGARAISDAAWNQRTTPDAATMRAGAPDNTYTPYGRRSVSNLAKLLGIEGQSPTVVTIINAAYNEVVFQRALVASIAPTEAGIGAGEGEGLHPALDGAFEMAAASKPTPDDITYAGLSPALDEQRAREVLAFGRAYFERGFIAAYAWCVTKKDADRLADAVVDHAWDHRDEGMDGDDVLPTALATSPRADGDRLREALVVAARDLRSVYDALKHGTPVVSIGAWGRLRAIEAALRSDYAEAGK